MEQSAAIDTTNVISSFVAETGPADIPDHLYDHAKVALLDWFAVTIAGCREPLVEIILKTVMKLGGEQQATVIGHNRKVSVPQAALVNGTASHALDYDDTLEAFLGHPSVTLFPGLLALAEHMEIAGEKFLTAYILGIQAGATIGRAAGLKHYMSGFHATSTIGHLASAAGASKLMGFDAAKTAQALGIAGTQAGGLKGVFGTMCKPFHAGRASEAGVMAALLASEGFTSSEKILEGEFGFFHVLNGEGNTAPLESLGIKWDLENLAQKYHASCHATHSPIEAALKICSAHDIAYDEIESITAEVSQLAIDAAGKLKPDAGLAGKFSIPYCIANSLINGDTGMQAFTDERINHREVQAFLDKISVNVSSKYKALEATVVLNTKQGDTHSEVANILKDIPSLQKKQVKIEAKFRDLVTPIIGKGKVEKLLLEVWRLESSADIRNIVELISG